MLIPLILALRSITITAPVDSVCLATNRLVPLAQVTVMGTTRGSTRVDTLARVTTVIDGPTAISFEDGGKFWTAWASIKCGDSMCETPRVSVGERYFVDPAWTYQPAGAVFDRASGRMVSLSELLRLLNAEGK